MRRPSEPVAVKVTFKWSVLSSIVTNPAILKRATVDILEFRISLPLARAKNAKRETGER